MGGDHKTEANNGNGSEAAPAAAAAGYPPMPTVADPPADGFADLLSFLGFNGNSGGNNGEGNGDGNGATHATPPADAYAPAAPTAPPVAPAPNMVPCVLNCGSLVRVADMYDHISTGACSAAEVSCEIPGCDARFRPADRETHAVDAAVQHVALLQSQLASTAGGAAPGNTAATPSSPPFRTGEPNCNAACAEFKAHVDRVKLWASHLVGSATGEPGTGDAAAPGSTWSLEQRAAAADAAVPLWSTAPGAYKGARLALFAATLLAVACAAKAVIGSGFIVALVLAWFGPSPVVLATRARHNPKRAIIIFVLLLVVGGKSLIGWIVLATLFGSAIRSLAGASLSPVVRRGRVRALFKDTSFTHFLLATGRVFAYSLATSVGVGMLRCILS